MPNLDKNLINQLDSEFSYCFYREGNYLVDVEPKKATHLNILSDKNCTEMIGKDIKLPKKKVVTMDWIMNKINSDKVYQSFAEKFKRIIDQSELKDTFSIYPTTYGIGLHNIFNRNSDTLQRQIESLLNHLNIDYTTEYSQAHWVFRFKISKSAENIERIKNL